MTVLIALLMSVAMITIILTTLGVFGLIQNINLLNFRMCVFIDQEIKYLTDNKLFTSETWINLRFDDFLKCQARSESNLRFIYDLANLRFIACAMLWFSEHELYESDEYRLARCFVSEHELYELYE